VAVTPILTSIQHHAFGWSIYIVVGVIVFIGMAGRLSSCISYLITKRRAKANDDLPPAAQPAGQRRSGLWSRIHTAYTRHIAVPAAFGRRHMRPIGSGWFSLPTRLQAILIFAYVAVNIIFSFVGISVDHSSGANPKGVQIAKQIGDRAGIICFYNLPLMFALAGRNDILIWLTGWSYKSMNLFHRWAGRMCIFHAIIHSACYTWMNRTKLAAKFDGMCWATGTFATVFICLIIPLSVRPLRQKFYEVFLIAHIVLSLVVLVLLFQHLKVMSGSYNAWLWACVGVWAFDRLVRVIRIAALSFRTMAFGQSGHNAVARIADHKTGLIRLTVDSSLPLKPAAGAYYFIYTPWSSTPWQSHPFSLASWEPSPSGSGTTFHFLIAPRRGATRRLRKRIEKYTAETAGTTEGTDVSLRVLLEGPYGVRHPVHKFDHVLLVAGGTGITAMLPYVFELAALGHRHVTVAWIVKDSEYANDVLARELSLENRGHANITVFVSSHGQLVRFDTHMTLNNEVITTVTSGGKEMQGTPQLQDDGQYSFFDDRHKIASSDDSHESQASTAVGSPPASPTDIKFPPEVAKPDTEDRYGQIGYKGGDLMAHLVMKNKFLNAESRAPSYTSNTSTACDCEQDEETEKEKEKENHLSSSDYPYPSSSGARRMGRSDSSATASTLASTDSSDSFSHRLVSGRPAMQLLISRAIGRLVGDQRVAIVGCGPSAMMDDLRSSVAESYGHGEGQVPASQLEYFEDAFEW
jgi:predicted ferric reductase